MKKVLFLTAVLFVLKLSGQTEYVKPLKAKKGELLFSDDFERTEIGENWQISEKFNGAFKIENHALVVKELKDAGHGSVARAHFDFSDVIIEFDLKFEGGDRFNIVMDDSNCKSVWAGHISRVAFNQKRGFKVQDDKTGTMNLEIRNQIKDNPKKKSELKPFLDTKFSEGKMSFVKGSWYHVKITKKGNVLECQVGDVIAQIKSEGIGHPTLNKFGPTVIGGHTVFDNFKIWEIKG